MPEQTQNANGQTSGGKESLVFSVNKHFVSQAVDEQIVIRSFLAKVKNRSN